MLNLLTQPRMRCLYNRKRYPLITFTAAPVSPAAIRTMYEPVGSVLMSKSSTFSPCCKVTFRVSST